MKDRRDLCNWIVEALRALNGSAPIKKVCEHIWQEHGPEIIDSGNFHFTWQSEDIYWAATQLRSKGMLKKASETSKSVWELAHPHA